MTEKEEKKKGRACGILQEVASWNWIGEVKANFEKVAFQLTPQSALRLITQVKEVPNKSAITSPARWGMELCPA